MQNRSVLIIALVSLAIGLSAPAVLLSPEALHARALWTGSSGTGFVSDTNLTNLIDGDPTTVWRSDSFSYSNVCVALTSPNPFVVTRVEAVISTLDSARSVGTIEIMRVGECDFVSTGVTIPSDGVAGSTVSFAMPAEFQVPISAIRFNNGNYWTELNELSFYGDPICPVDYANDLTNNGTALAYRQNTISADASGVVNGIYENDGTGYHQSGSDHNLLIDFGDDPTKVHYVAVNTNGYWKYPWAAIGSAVPYTGVGDMELFSSYTPTPTYTTNNGGSQDAPGHSWIVLPVSGQMLYAAGVRIDNYWGDLSEFMVLSVPEPATGLVLAAGLLVATRRRSRRQVTAK